jgi:hypothetical protein
LLALGFFPKEVYMKLAALAAALSLVLGTLTACGDRNPDQNRSASGGTADQQSQPANAPKRSQTRP